jgi:hypothetical protein
MQQPREPGARRQGAAQRTASTSALNVFCRRSAVPSASAALRL